MIEHSPSAEALDILSVYDRDLADNPKIAKDYAARLIDFLCEQRVSAAAEYRAAGERSEHVGSHNNIRGWTANRLRHRVVHPLAVRAAMNTHWRARLAYIFAGAVFGASLGNFLQEHGIDHIFTMIGLSFLALLIFPWGAYLPRPREREVLK